MNNNNKDGREWWEVDWDRRQERKNNIKTGCATCGSPDDHGLESNFTHQYDDGFDVKVGDDKSFISHLLREQRERDVEKVKLISDILLAIDYPDRKLHFALTPEDAKTFINNVVKAILGEDDK